MLSVYKNRIKICPHQCKFTYWNLQRVHQCLRHDLRNCCLMNLLSRIKNIVHEAFIDGSTQNMKCLISENWLILRTEPLEIWYNFSFSPFSWVYGSLFTSIYGWISHTEFEVFGWGLGSCGLVVWKENCGEFTYNSLMILFK